MTQPIDSIARSLSADMQALASVSQNVANLTTPGYRANRRVDGFETALTGLDLSDGALVNTGRPADLALQGHGFFGVQQDGKTFLTRSGQFRVDNEGRLVDGAGRAVLGEGGPITLAAGDFSIAENGDIHQAGSVVDRLALFDASSASALEALGDGLYSMTGDAVSASAKVHQGALEGSNVDPGSEMVHLMEITRHAGAVQHAISTYHAALIAGIDRIGKDS
jgi:flagellar basal body rod protein FlgG